jgi:hypothetical protein
MTRRQQQIAGLRDIALAVLGIALFITADIILHS